nr:triacylglycerol lipase [Acinetobacter sp. Marseille-Q1620]
MKKIVPALILGTTLLTPIMGFAITTSTYHNCGIQNDEVNCEAVSKTDWSLFSKQTEYAKTKYPLVFAHGLFGLSQIGPVNYWHNIPSDLARQGAKAYVTTVSAANSDAVRGEQLLKQVITIKALTGADKVNLIGHSQGVQSVRYVAGVRPDLVASVTGIAGSNKGSPVADVVKKYIQQPASVIGLDKPILAFINFFTGLETLLSGGGVSDQNVLAALNGLTKEGTAEYNAKFPQGIPETDCGNGEAKVNGINYYSWSGVGHSTNLLDLSDAGMLALNLFHDSPNDGLVPKCSSHLGEVIRDDYPQNHLDEVNQILGLVGSGAGNPVPLYSQHANRLKLAGL